MINNSDFENRLEKSLSHYYNTINLIDDLLKKKQNAQEIILLACSRLDSLANLQRKNQTGQKNSFIEFLLKFSGCKNFFQKISVGDLYWYIIYYSEISETLLVEKPGRIKRLGKDSEEFLNFIEKSTVPITGKSVRQISLRITKILEKYFRVKPNQKLSKKYTASYNILKDLIVKEFKDPSPEVIGESIKNLLERFKIGSIFYERYRCEVIHGFKISVDEKKFFTETKPFHTIFNYLFGDIYNIQFPGKFLRQILSNSLNTFSNYLKSKKSLPLDLFTEVYNIDEVATENVFKYLDHSSLNQFEDVKWQVKKTN